MVFLNSFKKVIKEKAAFFLTHLKKPNVLIPLSLGFIIALLGIIYISFYSKSASANWYNSSFQYRQRIPINNSTSTLTDYQVGITLNTSTLISAGKMQSDCDDIRFTAENGEELPYWIEENNPGCNQTNTKIWIKTSILPSNDSDIYVYYGNPSVSNGQNPDQTFLFFDNFSGTVLNTNKWESLTHASGTGASYNILSGTINFTTTTSGGYYWLYSKSQITAPYTMEVYVRNNYATGGSVVRVGQSTDITQSSNGNVYPSYSMDDAGNSTFRLVGDTTALGFLITSVANGSTSGVWRFKWPSTGSQLGDLDGTNIMTGTNSSVPLGNSYLYVGSPANSTTGTVSMDWVFARKYSATEPTIGTFGSEEVTPGPIGYWKMDEGAGTTTYNSVDNTAGTISNGPVWQNEDMCISGKCLYFDGTDDIVDTGKDLSWAETESFSMSGWVNMKRAGNATAWGKGTTGATWEYKMSIAGGSSPQFVYFNTSGGCGLCLTSSEVVQMNEWNHFAVTYDGTSESGVLYLNGQVTAEQVGVTGTFQNRANNLNIGRAYWSNSAAGTFPGMVDELKVYSYTRTPEEIKTEFIQGASGKGSAAVLGAHAIDTLSNGLVGYWKMDEVGVSGSSWTAFDSSMNNNSGTGVGHASVGTTAPGKFGNAGFFDGTDDYVSLGNPSALDLNNTPFTIAAWINIGSTALINSILMSEGNGNDKDYRLFAPDGRLEFDYEVSNGGEQDTMTSTTAISANRWYHVAAVYENDDAYTVNLYIDGELMETSTHSYGISTQNQVKTIGQYTGANEFKGSIDDVRIYRRALAHGEISKLYEWAPGPVAYWDFNENTSTTANDKSGNGYTGSITGAEWVPGKYGSALKFNGVDYVDIPSPSFPGIQGHITFSMWVNGDASIQPQANSVFEGYGVGSTRVLNVHLPWSNSTIYWDAGPGTAQYDRITKLANAADFEGNWNHWAFTKNISTGSMKMYLNGVLWHSGVGNTSPIGTLTNFRIGSFVDGTNNYDGLIDDFKIYNYERTPKQIVQDMNAGHPAVGSPVGSAVAHYKMDEGYGSTINNSGNAGVGLTGTLAVGTSAPTWTNDGKFGKALSFDGTSDYLTISDTSSSSIDFTTQMSMSAWVKTLKDPASVFSIFIEKGEPDEYEFYIRPVSGGHFAVEIGNSICDGVESPVIGQWYHAAATWDGSTVKIYVNGKLDATCARSYTMTPDDQPLVIGRNPDSNADFWKGDIDEVKLYNYPLTEDEIKVEYNRGKAIVLGSTSTGVGGTAPDNSASREYCVPGDSSTCTAPVGEWNFNEDVGGTGFDTSTNGNNGFFASGTAAPSWAPGIRGSAISFDGDADYITMGDVLDMGTSDWTTSLWFRTTDSDGNLISKSLAGSLAGRWFTILQSGGISALVQGSVAIGVTTPSAPYLDGGWHHVATTYDRDGDMSIYVDGMLKSGTSMAAINGENLQTSCSLLLGRYNATSDCTIPLIGSIKLNGLIDQVRIYNYVRTRAQIAWEYNKGAPIVHYKLDECQGTTINNGVKTYNDTPAGSNGTLTIGGGGQATVGTCASSGAWAAGATGKYGSSIDLDGTDDFIVAGTPSGLPSGSSPFTTSAWIKPGSQSTARAIICWGVDSANDKNCLRLGSNVILHYFWSNDLSVTVGSLVGAWHHVAVTYDGSNRIIYLDGKQVGSNTTTAATVTSTNLFIGQRGTGLEYFDGSIDEAKVFNYALTPQQIRTEYNNGAVRFE